ncbi:MAG: DUF1566 domain-containing protein [Parafilimonas sp.]
MNKFTFIYLLIFIVIINSSCSKEDNGFTASSSNQSSAKQNYFIGEHYGGGIIFYLNQSGTHGIIAAPDDLEEPASWSKKDTLNGTFSAKLGAGFTNTNSIYKTQGNPENEPDEYAALKCVELIQNGYNDWYLPSKDELNKMYLHKDVIGGFSTFSYWSSTEQNSSKAWFQNFTNGNQIAEVKTAGYAIRPVRYF